MSNRRPESIQGRDREIERLESLVVGGHRLLRFPRDLEQSFVADFSRRFLPYRQRVVLLTAVVLLVAGAMDSLFVQADVNLALVLRYGIVAPLVLTLVLFSRTAVFVHWQQPSLSLFSLVLAALMFGMMLLGDQVTVLMYSPGLLLVAMFAGAIVYLRFWLAVAVLLLIGAALVIFIVSLRPQEPAIGWALVMFYISSTIMSLFSGYRIEHAARRQFLHSRLLALKQGELELANRRLQELVDQDGLTGIANRRHFDEQLVAEWNRARRGGYPLSLLLVDLDFFKHYNDTYGHQAGDDCLIVVASVLRAHAQRAGDIAARYGGEEFVMILPATSREDAGRIGERVVADLAAFRIPHRHSEVAEVVTCSVGVATLVPSPLQAPRDLLAMADQALYAAKRAGRNRVVLAPESTSPGQAG